jgi:hypothetical protein
MSPPVSMFGARFRFHRSPLFVVLFGLLVLLVVVVLVTFLPQTSQRTRLSPVGRVHPVDDNGQQINLVHLFTHAFRLTHQAGAAIRAFYNVKSNLTDVKHKKNWRQLPSEPVTLADLLSHSILTDGLRKVFGNLQVTVNTRSRTRRHSDDDVLALDRVRGEESDRQRTVAAVLQANERARCGSDDSVGRQRPRRADERSSVVGRRLDRPVGRHSRVHW